MQTSEDIFVILYSNHWSCVKISKKVNSRFHSPPCYMIVRKHRRRQCFLFVSSSAGCLHDWDFWLAVTDQTRIPQRKWDTQHLKKKTQYVTTFHQQLCKHIVYSHTVTINTYKKPFPQPRGPKKSSVGRQTFLHTPLRLGQDQGNDAASFSTTVITQGKLCQGIHFKFKTESSLCVSLQMGRKMPQETPSRLTIHQ